MIECSSCILMFRCSIVVFLDFSRCLLISFSVRPGQVFRKPCFIELKRLAVVGMKHDTRSYCASSGLDVWDIILFIISSDCCVSRGTYHIPVLLFPVPLIISCPFFCTYISCLYSVMVHPSPQKNPNYISGAVLIFGRMWI